ncbi:MAG: gamma-glutamyltransferase, partial [Candidatus Limnocylindria bacterium]
RALIDDRRADPRAMPAVGGARAVGGVPVAGADAPHTTHICAMDERGMAVSLTTTLGGAFGSGVVAGDTGILLANVMTWFDPRPGLPNSIAPGKRILWAVAPAILERDGRARLVVGAPGGRKLISAVLQTIVNVVDFGDGPQAAVDRPRVHAEGPETWIEARVPEEVRARLAAMGHELVVREETLASSWFGRPSAILVDEDGTRRGGVNRMKSSVAAGY